MKNESKSTPGGTMTYSVWVWSTIATRGMKATVTSTSSQMDIPKYTLCPVKHKTSCTIGAVPKEQAYELIIADKVRTSATTGREITLRVSITANRLSPAEATITTLVGETSPTPTSGSTLPPSSFPTFPATTVSPGSLSNLFPTITPSPSSSSSPGRPGRHTRALAAVTNSALPLDPRLIGGQLAALAVLAAAITMVVVRLQLRTAQHPGSSARSSGSDGTPGSASAQPTTEQ